MPAGTNKTIGWIAVLAVLIPLLIAAWFAAPMFVPIYRWTKVDLPKLATATGSSEAQLGTWYQMQLRYAPRGEGDPLPWQIISSQPPYEQVYPDAIPEDLLLVRCTLRSANTGEAPGTTFINSSWKDHYYTAKALRLPPGTLGSNPKRPLVIYEALDFKRMDVTGADNARRTVLNWESDDLWADRDDGWSPPEAP
jgi:hypothetical protein